MKNKLWIVAIVLLSVFPLKGHLAHERFDSEQWKNWSETETSLSLRWDMMNSLRNNYELKGMTQIEIMELLGNPEMNTESEFNYYLGYSKHGINTGNLKVRFNKDKIVINFYVWQG